MNLRIMTANLRCDNSGDGPQAWQHRKEWAVENILKADADVVGFQECMSHMRVYLEENLPGYFVLGTGRDPYMRGEGMAVAYKRARFTPLWMKTFWLSYEPEKPGSTYGFDQSSCPRCCTAVQFDEKSTGNSFLFYNTHTDHVGPTARLLAAAQLRQTVALDIPRCPATPLAAFLTGDFNAPPTEHCYAVLTDQGGFTDLAPDLGTTYHAWGTIDGEEQIDYIFGKPIAAGKLTAAASLITEISPAGLYVSDHHWVLANIDIDEASA